MSKARKIIKAVIPEPVLKPVKRVAEYVAMGAAYGMPNPLKPSVPMSDRAKGWLEDLKRDGIIKIEGDPAILRAADYLDKEYFEKILASPTHTLDGSRFNDRRLWTFGVLTDEYKKFGMKLSNRISLLDNDLTPILRNHDIAAMLYNYYRRQPYYRNQPMIQYTDVAPGDKLEVGDAYHVDRYHQVSAMLLVTDQTVDQTHMEYVVGTHNRSFLKTDIEMDKPTCKRIAEENPDKIYRLVGKKGTLFVYDTSAIHCRRLKPHSRRKALIWTVTTGHHLEKFYESTREWPELEKEPDYVRGLYDKLKGAPEPFPKA